MYPVSEYKCKGIKFFAKNQGFPPENDVFYKEKTQKCTKNSMVGFMVGFMVGMMVGMWCFSVL